jgi:hypothetical protein
MRVLTLLLLTMTACLAQSEQSKVAAVIQQLERAEQTGDFNTWVSLWTSEKSASAETLRPYAKARPDVQYRPTKIYVDGDRAVVLLKATTEPFANTMLRRESGQWKIQDQLWRDTAPDANSVYALVPPGPGAFARAGSPWDRLTPALDSAKAARLGWQMKAVFDEAYLYIRIESSSELPAPGSTIEKPPGGWPVLKIAASVAGEFVLYDTVNVGDQATFDENGRANSHRAFAAYMIRLERGGREVFSASADLDPSPLLAVSGRNYEIRIPLATMGIIDSRTSKIMLGDAQWPKSAIVSFSVERYPR